MSDLILYTTEDGRSQIRLRAQAQTVWLTQIEMAELFDAAKQNISLHLKNVFADGELDEAATVKESLTIQMEGAARSSALPHSTIWTPSLQKEEDRALYNRALNLLSHGKYAIHESTEMGEDNKELFRCILSDFTTTFQFALPDILAATPPAGGT